MTLENLRNSYHLLLPNAERTTEGLLFNAFIPVEIKDDDLGCHSQVQANTSSLEGAEEEFLARIIPEILDGLITRIEVHLPSELAPSPFLVVAHSGEDTDPDQNQLRHHARRRRAPTCQETG